jgi:restriction system protein
MARSLYSVVKQAARAADRAARQSAREQARRQRAEEREYQRRVREYDRYSKQQARDARLQYLDDREDEVEQLNEEIRQRVEDLSTLLLSSPEAARPLDFRVLRARFVPTPYEEAGPPPAAPVRERFRTQVAPLGFFAGLFGGKEKHLAEVAAAAERDERNFQAALAAHERSLAAWNERNATTRATHAAAEAAREAEITRHNALVDEFEAAFRQANPDAVRDYFSLILTRSELPEGFPETFRLAYIPESRQLVVEHDLPTIDVIPEVAEYTFVKTKDEIRPKARKKGEVAELYRLIVASVALRVLNEIFSSDSAGAVRVAVFNGVVHTIDPGTGKAVAPCLVSLRATQDEFSHLVLDRIDPIACLKSLNASVSRKAEELAPVRPVMEFDMVDRRFVAEEDVIGSIETRPNIMDLTPAEFESLVTNTFRGMGLEARLTRSSRDGGVDCVAFDPRPVLGGKVVIQAKRYRNTVGVSAVRDLYGTMMNEGANKGILVTTAGYGPDAFAFAKDKPIELIDGGGLLYLLEQQGVQARIIMPA